MNLIQSIFSSVSNNPGKIEDSIINENWPRFKIISEVNSTVNSRLVPCILSNVKVKPVVVVKLFSDYLNLSLELVNSNPSRPRTSITKVTEYAVTRNLPDSIQAVFDFRHGLSP